MLSRAAGDHTILGASLDDSIGEAFDKTARLLEIQQIPGGPHLERLAREGDADRYKLPKPLSKTRDPTLRANCDFSYAGLKSAVRQLLCERLSAKARETMGEMAVRQEFAHVAAAFQKVAVDHLAERAERAIAWAKSSEPTLSAIVAAGGVAANGEVRRQLGAVARRANLPLVCPPIRLCTDNGVMVAWTGVLRLRLGLAERPLAHSDDVSLFVEVRPKWPLGPRDARSFTQQQQLAKRKEAQRANAQRVNGAKAAKKHKRGNGGEEYSAAAQPNCAKQARDETPADTA